MSINFFAARGHDKESPRLPSTLRRTVKWLPQIGDIFPDFRVKTTEGPIRFWDWADGSWVHLFSHPAAFTPVCTTEMASVASFGAAWKANNIKNMALTGSSVVEQVDWHAEIERLFGTPMCFPGAHDPGLRLARLFGMIHGKSDMHRPIRKSFLIDPSQHVQMIFEYPAYVGRNTEEILRTTKALQLRAATGAATPADWYGGDTAIIADGRPESDVLRDFGARSEYLTPYLRFVAPEL